MSISPRYNFATINWKQLVEEKMSVATDNQEELGKMQSLSQG